jgi:hypothetical protein
MTEPNTFPVGQHLGVEIDVGVWNAVSAPVDLSVACMFSHERGGAALTGGLLHLDQALGSSLIQLRAETAFRAEAMDTLLIRRPPSPVQAKTLMIIGLGDPDAWRAELMVRAVASILVMSAALRAASVALAPSLLDAGLQAGTLGDVGGAMMDGLVSGLTSARRLATLGLDEPLALRRWTFDANGGHAAVVATTFSRALAETQARSAPPA